MMEKKKPASKSVRKAASPKSAAAGAEEKSAIRKKPAPAASAAVKKVPAAKPAHRPQEEPHAAPVAYSQPAPQPAYAPAPETPPSYWQDRYGDNRIVLLIRDPYWCFVYWDLSADKQSEAIRELQKAGAKLMLRVYDVTDLEFDGTNAHRTMDIEVTEEATNWYINVWAADRAYCVDLGLLYPNGRFVTLARSNVVTTPRDSVSNVIDEEWMVVDETFDRLYQAAGASELGRASEAITKFMLKRVRADVSSGGLASMGSEGGRPRERRPEDFWLVVNTELIVYGATEPDAAVTVQGQPIRLNPDGTFSVRYALPDGKQTIPVKAVNAAGSQERQITPVVEKRTE
jgi:uncharacterized protein